MKRNTRRLRAVGIWGAAATALVVAGCGQDAAAPSAWTGYNEPVTEMSIDLARVDGGMSAADESPGFGDAYFRSFLGDDQPLSFSDPLARDPRMTGLENRNGASVQYLRVIWGDLQRGPEAASGDTSAGSALDWTGGASVSDGLLLPMGTLGFEHADRLVRPRTDRQVVEWISHTGSCWDGVILKILVPPAHDTTFAAHRKSPKNDGLTADDLFTFSTGPLTVSFPIDGISDLDSTVWIDDAHGVSFTGFERGDVDLCPRGGMLGTWVKVADDSLQGGFFRAKWVNPLGRLQGQVRGRWGVLSDSGRVFVGKIIGPQGRYLGHVRGRWEESPDQPGHGLFQGVWFMVNRDSTRTAVGKVRGVWGVSDRVADGGFLRGLWMKDCARDAGGA